jgi:hypothetical protein
MPGGDGSGPMGRGPMTGRGAGYCAGYNMPGFANPNFPRMGMGWGPGRGFGYGRGFGRGYGRGFGYGRGYARGRYFDPYFDPYDSGYYPPDPYW